MAKMNEKDGQIQQIQKKARALKERLAQQTEVRRSRSFYVFLTFLFHPLILGFSRLC